MPASTCGPRPAIDERRARGSTLTPVVERTVSATSLVDADQLVPDAAPRTRPPGVRTMPAWRPHDPVGHRARGDQRAAVELLVRPGQRAGAYRDGTDGSCGRPVPGGGHDRVDDCAVRTNRPPAGRGVPPRLLRRRPVPALPGRVPPPRGQRRRDPVARRRHHRRGRSADRGRTAPTARDRHARRRSRDAGLPGEVPRGRPDPLGRSDLPRRRRPGATGRGRHLPRRPCGARGRRLRTRPCLLR